MYEDCRKSLEVKSEKNMVCRVSKNDTRQRSLFAECQEKTLGKEVGLPSVKKKYSAKRGLPSVKKNTRQRSKFFFVEKKQEKKIKKPLPSVRFRTLGKK